MAKISKNEFLMVLRKSGLVEPKRLTKLLQKVDEDSAEAVGIQLIQDELATKWQVKFLMSGRNRLDIGNYRLLDRIRKDEFGDRFLAVQTSLARKVDIQLLPSALTKDRSSCDRFIQKARLAAQLDHPNLVHVFDIDQESGRFYLVTEHVGGNSLEETDVAQLNASTIARIISQSIEGLRYAHRHQVVHGCIGPADLVLDARSQIKIQNLPLSPLRQSPGSTDQPTAEQDFAALARIGSFLLKKGKVGDPEKRERLAQAFTDLSLATSESAPKIIASLSTLIEPEIPDAQPDVGGFDSPIATPSTSRPKKKKPEPAEEPPPINQPNYLQRLWLDNPVALIATSLVLVVALVGGSVFGAMALFGDGAPSTSLLESADDPSNQKVPTETGVLSQSTNQTDARTQNTKPSLPSKEEMNEFLAGIEDRDQSQSKNNDDNAVAAANPNGEPETPKPQAILASPENQRPTDDSGQPITANTPKNGDDPAVADVTNAANNAMTNVVATAKPDDVVPEPNQPDPEHTDLTAIRGVAEATQAVLRKGGVMSLEQIAQMNEIEVRDAIRRGGWSTANKVADYKNWVMQSKSIVGDDSPIKAVTMSTDGGTSDSVTTGPDPQGPFANFPRTTSLPDMENTNEFKIADLTIPRQYLLGAEIICEPGAARGRTSFELIRTDEDKQKWLVVVKKSPKQDAMPIGYFRKSTDAFFFQWLPDATTDKNTSKLAPYLRNCFIKLVLPEDQSTILTLREPLKIADLRLTQESLWNEVEIQIPAMPAAECIVVEVLPMRIPNVETNIPNSRVERGMPARIWLKQQDKTGFLWIQVAGELRSKLKLRSNLMVLGRGSVQPVPNIKALQESALSLERAAIQSQRLYDSFTFQTANLSQTDYDQRKAELLKDVKAKQQLREKMNKYGEVLPKILNQPISVRVYSKLGNLQTVLAVTDPTIEQSEK